MLAVAMTILALCGPGVVRAEDFEWTNAAETGAWNTSDYNWWDGSQDSNWPDPEAALDRIDPAIAMPETALLGPDYGGTIVVDSQVNTGGITVSGGPYTLDVQVSNRIVQREDFDTTSYGLESCIKETGLDLYGPITVTGGAPTPEIIVAGTITAAGGNGTFVGVEDDIHLEYRSGERIPRIRFDNSNEVDGMGSPVNENRWGNNKTMSLTADLSILEMTTGPIAKESHGQDITEEIGTLEFGGAAMVYIHVDTFDWDPEESSGNRAMYRYTPDYNTTLSVKSVERVGKGVISLVGEDNFNPSAIFGGELGVEHRIICRDQAPELIVGPTISDPDGDYQRTMVEPYIINSKHNRFLTYDQQVGFKSAGSDGVFFADQDQTGKIVTVWNPGFGGTWNTFTEDRSVFAMVVHSDLHPESSGGIDMPDWELGEYTLTITSGGLITSQGFLEINCNLIAGNGLDDKRELVATNMAHSVEYRGTIAADGMTIASYKTQNTLGHRTVIISSNNDGLLTGPVSIWQQRGYKTHFRDPNATGVGNDLTIGGGRVHLQAPGETFAFGNLSVGDGWLDIDRARFTTTAEPDTVREILLKEGINSQYLELSLDPDGDTYSIGYAPDVDRDGNDVLVVNHALIADSNLDGLVDVTDLAVMAANWESDEGQWYTGDFNYDGLVDVSDLAILAAHWGNEQTKGASPVPEPATLALLTVGGMGLVSRRRRRR
jgi:hypothetical protein